MPSSSEEVATRPRRRAELQAVFDFFALRDGDAAVMRADERFSGEIVDRAGDAFGEAAIVDEDERGAMGADQFEQLGMDGAPDGAGERGLATRGRWGADRCRRGGHVFDWDFDAQVETLGFAGVDDGDWAIDGGVEGRIQIR